jgi:hypothetical protein
MPLIYSRRTSQSHANLPIAFFTALALIAALLYLQLLYAMSWILRPFYNSSQEFPPLRHPIEKAEKLTVNIILGIVPTSFYRSPPVSDTLHMHENSANRISSAPRYAQEPASYTQSTTIFPAPLPLCYPESSMERTGILHHNSRLLAPASSSYSTRDSSVYDTVKKYTTSKHRISVVETHQSQSQQVTQAYAQTQTNSSVPVPVIPASIDHSPALSFDGAREASMHSFPTEVDDSNDSLMLRVSKRVKSRSTESYPGKFPVSGWLDYSNLATAEMNFRERGTTSVRPFSDY